MTIDLVQGTDAWKLARLGKVTASRVADMVAKTKTGWGASRKNYMAQLVTERLTGMVAPTYVSKAMQGGTEREPEARRAYALVSDADIIQVGFIDHPTIAMSGASHDGIIGDVGGCEFKCPLPATHMETLLGASIDGDYIMQMQWQMACRPTQQWCDFVSYNPDFPPEMQLLIQRVKRDQDVIAYLEKEVPIFLNEVSEKVDALNERYGLKEAA